MSEETKKPFNYKFVIGTIVVIGVAVGVLVPLGIFLANNNKTETITYKVKLEQPSTGGTLSISKNDLEVGEEFTIISKANQGYDLETLTLTYFDDADKEKTDSISMTAPIVGGTETTAYKMSKGGITITGTYTTKANDEVLEDAK